MSAEDLDLIDTAALVGELARRHVAALIVMQRDGRDGKSTDTYVSCHGNGTLLIGMAEQAKQHLLRLAARREADERNP